MKEDRDSPPLIFDWRPAERRSPALIKWMLITAFGMACFSYVFRVVYPQSQRAAPAPQQITVLNPADPAMRGLLHRVADQDFLVIPEPSPAGEVSLDDHMPVFHPNYENHQYQLKDLPQGSFNVPQVRLMDPKAPLLPPPDLSKLKKAAEPNARPSKDKPQLVLYFSGALAGRKILHAPALSDLRLTDPEAWRFHVGVDGRGRVSFALPVATGEPATLCQELVERLNQLRFEPIAPAPGSVGLPEENVAWDTALLQWTTVAKAQ